MSNELQLVGIALDCGDPRSLSRFYQELLGGTVLWKSDESVGLRIPGIGPVLQLARVEDYRPPTWPASAVPKQIHLDLSAGDDLDGQEARAIELGARRADFQPDPDRWRVLFDPAGHPFCITAVTPSPPVPPDTDALERASIE